MEKDYVDKTKKLFTKREFQRALIRINNKTSLDMFGISNKILKKITNVAKEMILELFNKCLSNEYIPKAWRSSIITMIPKKSEGLTDPANYRPISITACIARLFERMVLVRLQEHLKKNKILIDQQSGFRAKRSTKDNLVFLAQKINETFNRKKNMLCIFFDITAAFDKVWHRGLLMKLIQIKTPHYIIKIIEKFLDDRNFAVKVSSHTTEKRSISCGVPQGAVLSPTLFSIYINDSPIKMDLNKRYSLVFADDLLYAEIYKNKTNSLEKRINAYLIKLEHWANKWRLSLAPHKCQYIVFTNKHTIDDFRLMIYGQPLKMVDDPKFLGIRFDSKLKYTNQIDHIINSCNKRMGILKTLSSKFWNINESTLLNISY
jgi:hypothetical protein